jgi:hypothetical protein
MISTKADNLPEHGRQTQNAAGPLKAKIGRVETFFGSFHHNLLTSIQWQISYASLLTISSAASVLRLFLEARLGKVRLGRPSLPPLLGPARRTEREPCELRRSICALRFAYPTPHLSAT